MKLKPTFLAVACGCLLIEGQSGSVADSHLAPQFNVSREVKTVEPERGLRALQVMTWNIDRGERLEAVGAAIKARPADLCLLQEVDSNTSRAGNKDVVTELAKRLHLNAAYGIEFEELSQERGAPAYIGQATLTRLPMAKSRVLRFERQSSFWQPHGWIPSSLPLMQRRQGSRIALVTELTFAGRLLVVYNVHLESRSAGMIQARQLDEIFADAKQYAPETAVIIGGDVNSKYLPSIFLHKLEREGYRSALGERVERTHAIAMALDWLFAKGPIAFEAGAVHREFKGSDHYPIYATLTASEREPDLTHAEHVQQDVKRERKDRGAE